MFFNRRSAILSAGILLSLLGLAVFLNNATAGKKPPAPPPPPPPAGLICFGYGNQYWEMNGDGSAKQPVTSQLLNDLFSRPAGPSSKDHGGYTWWLATVILDDGNLYPDGYPHRELFVARSDYDASGAPAGMRWVQLTNLFEANVKPREVTCWSNDLLDSFVSFIGYDFDQEAYFVYKADFFTDDDGVPSAGPVTQMMEVPGLMPFHWSPDGKSIVYEFKPPESSTARIMVHHVGDEQATEICDTGSSSSWGEQPRWSPLGVLPERIAFYKPGSYRLCTIEPDGSNLTTIYDQGSWGWGDFLRDPYWSPDGKYLACTHVLGKLGKGGVASWSTQISIVPSEGGVIATDLTQDLDGKTNKEVAGWRVPLLP